MIREAGEPGIAIPILPARDLHETRSFYERLGFRVTGWWPQEFGGYAIVWKGDITMHFFAFKEVDPAKNYAQCYWRVKDVDALYAECKSAFADRSGTGAITKLEDKDWGMREFAISDPNGNLIRVGQEL